MGLVFRDAEYLYLKLNLKAAVGAQHPYKSEPRSWLQNAMILQKSAQTVEGGSSTPRLPSWVVIAPAGWRETLRKIYLHVLAGSRGLLVEERESLHLSKQTEDAWERRTLGAGKISTIAPSAMSNRVINSAD